MNGGITRKETDKSMFSRESFALQNCYKLSPVLVSLLAAGRVDGSRAVAVHPSVQLATRCYPAAADHCSLAGHTGRGHLLRRRSKARSRAVRVGRRDAVRR